MTSDASDPQLPSNPELGKRIKQARRALGMTQWDLARAITPTKTTQATISSIEKGEISSEFLLPVCRYLNIPPPPIGASPELARWIELGHTMSQFPSVFEHHLGQLEAMARSLKERPALTEQTDARSPVRDEARKQKRR